MHSTLRPKNNLFMIACWTIGVGTLLFVTSGSAALSCLIGAAFGGWAGSLQRKALSRDAELFRAADTALDVRRVMVASREGKRAITLGWVTAALLFIPAANSDSMVLVFAKVSAGFFSFTLLRDVVAYSALEAVAGSSVGGENQAS